MCRTLDWLKFSRDFDLHKFPAVGLWYVGWLVTLPYASPLFVERLGITVQLASGKL